MEKLADRIPSRAASQTPSETTAQDASLSTSQGFSAPFSGHFLDKSPEAVTARAIYLKTLFGGVGALAVVIFAVFSIYWGSLWRTPHHALPGWIVVSLRLSCFLLSISY
jgi:hypothetical protein